MITVRYTCSECGVKDRAVQVPAREHADVDVVYWVREVVGRCVSDDHRKVSPNCNATKIQNLTLPMEGAEFIGQQIE